MNNEDHDCRKINDKNLWVEFDKLKISGESTQEVILFKEPEKGHQQLEGTLLHNVILTNKEYMIIAKAFTKIDPFDKIYESWSYYISGLNDEGRYFIRPLKNFPFEKYVGNQKPTIEDIVNWMNRSDEGFDTRIQGDVLAKFVNVEDTSLDNKRTQKRTIDVSDRALQLRERERALTSPQSQLTPLAFTSVPKELGYGFYQPQQSRKPKRPQSLFSGMFQVSDGENTISVEGIKYSEITDSPLKLGNHKLFTEGKIFASKVVPFICVLAESLILQHHEHAVKELVIPDKCVVILAAQRGRDFDLKDLNYLKKAYD